MILVRLNDDKVAPIMERREDEVKKCESVTCRNVACIYLDMDCDECIFSKNNVHDLEMVEVKFKFIEEE